MTATIEQTGLTPTGPRFGLRELIRMRTQPITRNDLMRQRYGEVIRMKVFGVEMFPCYGLDAAEQVLINRDRAFAAGPAWGHFIGPFFRRGLLLLDFEEHLHHRRILQAAFANQALRSYHEVMLPHIKRGMVHWGEVPNPRMNELFKQLTLDLALETFVGIDLPQEEQDRLNKAFINAVRAGTSVVRANVPFTPWARGLVARKELEAFFYKHIPAKREHGGDDLFAQLCLAKSDEGDEFSDDDIVNHMIFTLMAAHDTSTITMTAMAYYLAKHPEWQEKARAEAIANDTDYDTNQTLDVLTRVMKEAIRLCSPVPSIPRQALRDTTVNGYLIKKGSFVTVSPYYNHRDRTVWTNPDEFDPDRFSDERREDQAHRMAFEGFGGGVHKCIGMHFARTQVRAIFQELLRTYKWSVPDDYTWPLDLVALPFPRDRLPVTLERLS